ncbi:hypothetical protein AHF37_11109 [Paragonimus kellicotti]|nr:hypothetical protein AHF37_11109 [Paragonimus kellicotti]
MISPSALSLFVHDGSSVKCDQLTIYQIHTSVFVAIGKQLLFLQIVFHPGISNDCDKRKKRLLSQMIIHLSSAFLSIRCN